MKATFTTPIPQWMNDTAEVIGKARMESNTFARNNNKAFDAPDNYRIDVRGALAELVVFHIFDSNGWEYWSAPMVETKPQPGPDLIFRTSKIDIKGIMPKSQNFYVTKSKADKNKELTHYFFVSIQDDHAFVYSFTAKEVLTWDVYTFKNGNEAYYRPIVKINTDEEKEM